MRRDRADNANVATVLGVILARAGSKGLPDKCGRPLLGRPVISYTFEHAGQCQLIDAVVLTTDSGVLKNLAVCAGVEVIDRPPSLATDFATVDDAARHAVNCWEERHGRVVDAVVLLYGNIPIRAADLLSRAIGHLFDTGADSVRSVAPIGRHHPDWLHRLDGDRMIQLRTNSIYRRQDLEPLYYHDGAAAVVARAALFGALDHPDDHQAFWGRDRRSLIQNPEDSVDIDEPLDFFVAEALLRAKGELADATT